MVDRPYCHHGRSNRTTHSKIYIPTVRKNRSDIIYTRNYTNEEKDMARRISIASILRSKGEKLKLSGSNYIWGENPNRIYIRDNYWYNHYTQKGGDTIDFLREFFNLDYPSALNYLIDKGIGYLSVPTQKKKKVELKVPKKSYRTERLMKYLCDFRKISAKVVCFFISRHMLFETAYHHNIAFLGLNPNGEIKNIHLQGTNPKHRFKMTVSGSEAEYSFHYIGSNENIYLFESPIDMLSYITLFSFSWEKNSYAASCSVSDRVLFQCLEDYPHLKNVFLCFDNDKAGQEANKRIREKLLDMGYNVQILIPKFKDWNEDLMKEGELK